VYWRPCRVGGAAQPRLGAGVRPASLPVSRSRVGHWCELQLTALDMTRNHRRQPNPCTIAARAGSLAAPRHARQDGPPPTPHTGIDHPCLPSCDPIPPTPHTGIDHRCHATRSATAPFHYRPHAHYHQNHLCGRQRCAVAALAQSVDFRVSNGRLSDSCCKHCGTHVQRCRKGAVRAISYISRGSRVRAD
jgi:hypothetical protein